MEDSSLSTGGGDTGSLLDTSDTDKMVSSEVSDEGIGSDEGSDLTVDIVQETEESEESSIESLEDFPETQPSSFLGRLKSFDISKAVQTIPAWITMFVCGVSLVVAGATLDTLDKVVDGNVSWSIFYTRATGVCVGSLLGGLITDEVITRIQKSYKSSIILDKKKGNPSTVDKVMSWFLRFVLSVHCYLLVIIILFIVLYILIPTFPYYITLNIFMFGIGFCFGAGQCGAMVCVGWIWKEKTTIPMQIFQLHLGVGVVLFPYAMVYILKKFEDPEDQLNYGYWTGALFSAAPIIFLIFFPSPLSPSLTTNEAKEMVELEDLTEEESEGQEGDATKIGEVPKTTRNLYWVLIGVFYVFIAATEVILPSLYVKFMTREDDPISDSAVATKYLTAHYLLYLLSKVAVIFLVSLIPGVYILGVDLVFSILCGLMLVLFPRTLIVIRISFVAAGWFVSQLFGLGFSVPVRYGVNMCGVGGASTVIGAAIGVGLTSSVAAIMDASGNDVSLFYSYLFFGIGSLGVWVLLLGVGSLIKIKYVLGEKKVTLKLIWKNL